MPTSPIGVLTIYLAALGSMVAAVQLRAEATDPIRPTERGAARGWIETGVPRLDPDDPMANAAMLMSTLATVGARDLDSAGCRHPARFFTLLLDGRLSHVRFSPRAVCQLKRLKHISAA